MQFSLGKLTGHLKRNLTYTEEKKKEAQVQFKFHIDSILVYLI